MTLVAGFTPAYAGNTSWARMLSNLTKVHPRIRGEYCWLFSASSSMIGSPPHTRGIPGLNLTDVRVLGFTPAYAGNTFLLASIRLSSWVHPRIRGEYDVLID